MRGDDHPTVVCGNILIGFGTVVKVLAVVDEIGRGRESPRVDAADSWYDDAGICRREGTES